jgi:anion-transporting  ArsA/GET3 family ATPase
MSGLLDRQFVIVAGKGGVGRTTVALLVGKLAAARGRRTLVCLVGAPPRYEELLGGLKIGAKACEVSARLHVVNLDPISAREEYGLAVLKSPTLHRLVFGSRIVRTFLDAVPGLAEWAMLGKATHHALHGPGGRPEYDLVVFDSPATGHGLDVLSLPAAIVSAVPGGRIRDEAAERVALMSDPERCEVVPVTLPEEMPVSEVLELMQGLEKRGLAMSRIVVNMVREETVGRELEALVEGHGARVPDWLVPSAVALSRERAQRDALARLAADTGLETIALPALDGPGLDASGLAKLARAFEQQTQTS